MYSVHGDQSRTRLLLSMGNHKRWGIKVGYGSSAAWRTSLNQTSHDQYVITTSGGLEAALPVNWVVTGVSEHLSTQSASDTALRRKIWGLILQQEHHSEYVWGRMTDTLLELSNRLYRLSAHRLYYQGASTTTFFRCSMQIAEPYEWRGFKFRDPEHCAEKSPKKVGIVRKENST
ncbi:hypothetical protein BDZ91DRAFT_767897 [Kalaharituber pfeilii]|nr:hypothetical protein BDZ91DRAFT_767897 [Kalaharituber pfeilii]